MLKWLQSQQLICHARDISNSQLATQLNQSAWSKHDFLIMCTHDCTGRN